MQKSAQGAAESEQSSQAELRQLDARFLAEAVFRIDAEIKAGLEAPTSDRDEAFQLSICRGLSAIVPERVGVCRGFLIDGEGAIAGSGVLLLNIERFPTLRALGQGTFKPIGAPIDAAVAYLETRDTLDLRDSSPALLQVFEGVAAVRRLSRSSLLQSGDAAPPPSPPFYCAVWAREILVDEGATPVRVLEQRVGTLRRGRIPRRELPDALAAGTLMMTPVLVEDASGRRHRRPFYSPGTELTFTGGPRALGPSIAHLAWALSHATRETSASTNASSGVYPRSGAALSPSIDALSDKTRIA